VTRARRIWSSRALLIVVAAWTAAGLFFASQLYLLFPITSGRHMSFGRALAVNLPFYYLWALLTPLILRLAERFPVRTDTWKRAFFVHGSASFILPSVQLLAACVLFQVLLPAPRGETLRETVTDIFRLNFHANFLTYWGLVAFAWGRIAYRNYRNRELQTSRLQTQLAQAELRALKMQLRPHFLFNTLNSIAALMQKDPVAAEKMVLQLADFLRLTLHNTGLQEVSLREEFVFLERYLQIEKTRFQDRLTIRFRIRSEVLEARVPNLILQPLVENAIRHGIARDSSARQLEVSATHQNGMLHLRVWDDGPGVPPGGLKEGIGLANTRERLTLLYGASHELRCESTPPRGFAVALSFPFRPQGSAEESARAVSEASRASSTVAARPPLVYGF
jgi:two-component system, LytTR family, sensor kinase